MRPLGSYWCLTGVLLVSYWCLTGVLLGSYWGLTGSGTKEMGYFLEVCFEISFESESGVSGNGKTEFRAGGVAKTRF